MSWVNVVGSPEVLLCSSLHMLGCLLVMFLYCLSMLFFGWSFVLMTLDGADTFLPPWFLWCFFPELVSPSSPSIFLVVFLYSLAVDRVFFCSIGIVNATFLHHSLLRLPILQGFGITY